MPQPGELEVSLAPEPQLLHDPPRGQTDRQCPRTAQTSQILQALSAADDRGSGKAEEPEKPFLPQQQIYGTSLSVGKA